MVGLGSCKKLQLWYLQVKAFLYTQLCQSLYPPNLQQSKEKTLTAENLC